MKNLLLIMLCTLVFCSCSSKKNFKDIAVEETISVETYEIVQEERKQSISGFGNLTFRRKTDISSAIDGTIRDIFVEEGELVQEFQVLASLSNIQLEIRKVQAEASLYSAKTAQELAKIRYREGRLNLESRLIDIEKSEEQLKQGMLELTHQRALLKNKKALLDIGGTTAEEIASMELMLSALETENIILKKDIFIKYIGLRDQDIKSYGWIVPDDPQERRTLVIDLNTLSFKSEIKTSEARVKSASTELASVDALLEETIISAPMHGVIGVIYLAEGERTIAGSKIITIFDPKELDLVFTLPEEIGVLLHIGQRLDLSIDAVKGQQFSADIRQISPTIDPRSGNMTIKAALDNKAGSLKPGMFSRFSLTYGEPQNIIRIPEEAIAKKEGNQAMVFKLSGRRVYPKNIQIDSSAEGSCILKAGLDAGDIVILTPSPMLKEGEEVHVK